MKVTSLIISNYGSFHGTHRIPMSDLGLVFVKGQNLDEPKSPSNGSGKSTLFDALDWALFGENPRGDSAKSVVNDEAGKNCFVIVYLKEGVETCVVFRYRQLGKEGSGVRFFHANKDLTTMDSDKTQEIINKYLGLDRTVFKAAVYRAQGDTFNFAEATDGERKELLTALIPELQEVDKIRDTAKEKLQKVQEKRATLSGSTQQAETELASLKSVDWQSAETAWKQHQQIKLASAQQGRESAEANLADAKIQLAHLQYLQQELQGLQKPVPSTIAAKRLEEMAAGKNAAHTELQLRLAEYKRIQDELNALTKVTTGKCSRCKVQVTGEHLEKERLDLEASKALVMAAGKTARAVLDTWEATYGQALLASQQEAQANQDAIIAHNQKYGQIQSQISVLLNLQKQLPTLEASAQHWYMHLEGLKAETWPGDFQRTQATQRMGDLEKYLHMVAEERNKLDHQAKLLTFWIDALTAKGLKNLILDSRIEDMSAAANTWIQAVTGKTTWCRFETQAMSQKGVLSEKLNLRIFRHNPDGSITERNFKSWSGGEKTRVALGADQGLSKLIADRATKSWELRILDEAFSRGLDGGGREAVFSEIQKMEGKTVFVVDHSDISNFFENTWVVQVHKRRSQLLINGVSCMVQDNNPWTYLPVKS